MSKEIKFNVKVLVDGREQLTTLTVDANTARKAFDSVSKASEGFASTFIKLSQKAQLFDALTNGIEKVKGVIEGTTASYRSFDEAMRAANTMAGKGPEEFKKLKDSVADLSKEIPVARETLAKGLYQTISNGVPEDNMLAFLETSAKSAVGGIADLEKVVTVTSTVIKNYGAAWTDAAAIQDKIQLTVTSFEQLADALPRVSGNAATLGVSIDELLASFATLTGVSGNTAEVSTQLAAIFTALVKPSSEAAKMAEAMGIQFDAAAVKSAGGLQNFLTSLDRSVKAYAASSGVLRPNRETNLLLRDGK